MIHITRSLTDMRLSIYSVISCLVIVYSVLASCTTQKDLTYLQGIDRDGESFPLIPPGEYRIQAQDILYVKLLSYNQEFNSLVDFSQTGTYALGEGYLYINGYQVNDSGYVEIPFVGYVRVRGATVEEAKELITVETRKIIKDPVVIVKLLSFKFTILGEVRSPGIHRNYNQQLTILEAIGMAGDITEFGNRQEVLVIRSKPGTTLTFELNLLDKSLLASEGFYILPNDVIYVRPLHSRVMRTNIPTISFFFASLSTLLLVINFFK